MICLAILAAAVVGGCGAPTVPDAEAQLVENYLDPLSAAGLDFSITTTCNLDGHRTQVPWHLVTEIQVDGTLDAVADVFEAGDVVMRRDRIPVLLQQNFNRPETGWNGSMTSTRDGARLGLTFNNVTVEDHREALGWSERCRVAGDEGAGG